MWRGRYVWRQGVWVAYRYYWTPAGYAYCEGYWDYPLARRGVLFAPVAFAQPVYARPAAPVQPRSIKLDVPKAAVARAQAPGRPEVCAARWQSAASEGRAAEGEPAEGTPQAAEGGASAAGKPAAAAAPGRDAARGAAAARRAAAEGPAAGAPAPREARAAR